MAKAQTVRGITVEVEGLSQVRKGLRELDPALTKKLKPVFADIAEKVAADVRARMSDFKRPSDRAKASVKAKSTTTYAAVSAGGSGAPYYPWLDFGGWVGRGHNAARHKSKYDRRITSANVATKGGSIYREWMGKPVGEGRYIYPALRDARPRTSQEVIDAVESVAHEAGFDTKEAV